MRKLVTAAAVLCCTSVLFAQKTTQLKVGGGGSPHVRTDWSIDGAAISIVYGRPYLKGRDLKTMTPAGQVWRIGADEATTLKTDKPLKFGAQSVPAGTYTLFAVPGAKEWHLAINRQTGQWGTAYDQSQDLGRVPMTVSALETPAEQVTFVIDDTPAGATLHIDWGTVRASTNFTVGQ
jgi:hypothetical protein